MFLFLVGLACLFPLSMYCLYLAMLHQRSRPTMVPGPWDFAGVLLALSGFLVIGGTIVVFAVHGAVRDFWLLGGPIHDLRDVHARVGAFTFAVWGTYFLILVGGSIYLITQRRAVTVIYHLTPAELDMMIESALARLGLPATRRGARWLVGIIDRPLATVDKLMSGESVPESASKGVVAIDGSEAMRHASLRWQYATGTLRADLEAELARDLATYSPPPSPAATWFMTIGASLFTIMIFLLGTFLLILFR